MFEMGSVCGNALCYAAAGYVPGIVIGFLIWLVARKSAPMPLYLADIYSFVLPIAVWFVMNKYHWTLVEDKHSLAHFQELMLLGWIWSIWIIVRLVMPRCTHKLRFRMAAINVGSLTVAAAVLLGLFFPGF